MLSNLPTHFLTYDAIFYSDLLRNNLALAIAKRAPPPY